MWWRRRSIKPAKQLFSQSSYSVIQLHFVQKNPVHHRHIKREDAMLFASKTIIIKSNEMNPIILGNKTGRDCFLPDHSLPRDIQEIIHCGNHNKQCNLRSITAICAAFLLTFILTKSPFSKWIPSPHPWWTSQWACRRIITLPIKYDTICSLGVKPLHRWTFANIQTDLQLRNGAIQKSS